MDKPRWRAVRERLKAIGVNREVAILSTARMADAFCNSVLIVLLPLYVLKIPKGSFFARFPDETLIGFLVSLAGLMFALTQPAAGAVSDWAGRRKPFIVGGLAVLVVATVSFITADSYRALVGLRILQGAGIAFTIPTALTLIADYADRSSVGGSMGVFSTARMVGFAVGPLVGGTLMEALSFEAAFLAGAAGAFLSLVLVLAFVPERRPERPGRARGQHPPTDSVVDAAADAIASLPFDGDRPLQDGLDRWGNRRSRVRWVNRQLYVLGAAIFVMALSISLIAAVEPELNRRLSQTAVGFGVAFSMLTLARILFQIPIGRLSDRIGRKHLISIGLVMLIPLTAFQALAPSTLLLSADRFLLGIATAMIVAPAYATVADLGLPGLRVRQMSVMTMSFGMGVAMGPLLSGTLAGILRFETPFYVGSALSAIVAALVHLLVVESHPREAEGGKG